jgi:hypothetical protein
MGFVYLAFDMAPKDVVQYCEIRWAGRPVMSPKQEMTLTGNIYPRTYMEIYAFWAIAPNIVHDDDDDDDDVTCYNILFITSAAVY